MHPVSVSIVSACRNERRHIHAFLDSILFQQMGETGWEVIIADGMSDDGTRDVLEQYTAAHSHIRIIDNPGRIVSTGLNAAIMAARGEIIVRMDAHTRYARNYCHCCLKELERTGAQNVGGPLRTEARGLRARAIAAAYHSGFSTGGARFHDSSWEGFVDTVPYGCWRRATLIQLGLFDEAMIRNQDDELNLRIMRTGGKIWQTPRIVSWYSPRSEISALFLQYFQYGFWKVAVIRKHKIPASWRHLVPIAAIAANLMSLAGAAIGFITDPAGPMFKICTGLWLSSIGGYAVLNLGASAITASRNQWVLFRYLPVVFGAFHFSWGLGFLIGLLRSPWRPQPVFTDSLYARITR
jgi:succinoglycan biosynthesis protein ExoA